MTPIQTRHDPTDPAALLEVSLVSLLMVRMLARVDYFARLVITVLKCSDFGCCWCGLLVRMVARVYLTLKMFTVFKLIDGLLRVWSFEIYFGLVGG